MRSNPEIKRERISQAAGVSLRGQVYYCYLHPLSDFQRGDSLLYRKFLLNHELCKQIALQKQGTENRRLRLEDIKTFFSKIVIVDIIKFM